MGDDEHRTIASDSRDMNLVEVDDELGQGTGDGSLPQGYTVDNLVKHVGKVRPWKYFVQWYGYTPRYYTIEPPKHITQHLIHRYSKKWKKENNVAQCVKT